MPDSVFVDFNDASKLPGVPWLVQDSFRNAVDLFMEKVYPGTFTSTYERDVFTAYVTDESIDVKLAVTNKTIDTTGMTFKDLRSVLEVVQVPEHAEVFLGFDEVHLEWECREEDVHTFHIPTAELAFDVQQLLNPKKVEPQIRVEIDGDVTYIPEEVLGSLQEFVRAIGR